MSNVVIVKPIKRSTWGGQIRYKNTKDSLVPMFDKTGTIVTGLTNEDADRLGKILQKDLSPASKFWHEYRVLMTDKQREFNMDNPEHELAIKFLQADKRVANSQEELDKGEYPYADYVIFDEEKAAIEKNKGFTLKRKAVAEFAKLSIDQMIDILKLYPGYVNMTSVTPDIIETNLYQKLEDNPARFLTLTSDKKLDMKIFLKDLVNSKLLRKNKSAFYYGEDFIGHDEESAITFLDDPQHQSLKIDLATQIKNKK